jgi:predicted glycoside hydrolase/deacetylase ChbG (UPF0249 family)
MSKTITNRLLIVNADDLGITEGSNRGIIHCFNNGIVTSTSLIANGFCFDDAVRLTRKNPGLGVGVHLTLIFEKPILKPSFIKSLVNEKGEFHYSHKTFIKRYLLRKIDFSEVYKELQAQIEKVLDCGIRITHIDSHQHIHVLPGILGKVVELAVKYKIKFIRIPMDSFATINSSNDVCLALIALLAKNKLKRNGIRSAEAFLRLSNNIDRASDNLNNFFSIKNKGIAEISCHPAYIDNLYVERYDSYYKNLRFFHKPEQEIEILTNGNLKTLISAESIELTNYGLLS